MNLHVRIEGVEELQRDWRRALSEVASSMATAVQKGTEEAARDARGHHRYKDRTYNLTKSVAGRLTDRALGAGGAALGELVADAPYAGYVDAWSGFMGLAYLQCERVMVREIEHGIARARVIVEE
ncbi:hypothetical protein LZC95_19865 [Pendulispora brunnea]|uniref:Uncharacterized protein n=1 Tax=Pendulispora brunnea TaxID=2905690 RepID=A0ABZ2KRW2_9BACT